MSGINAKLTPLTAAEVTAYQPPGQIIRHLDRLDRSVNPRLLDYGCGRGKLVWWLRVHGWDAHGFEPNPLYVANGREAGRALGFDPDFLHSDAADIPDGCVDVLYSVQVVEHISDLRSSALEMRRLLHPGGVGRHIFPSRRRPIEPHVRLPLVHWTQSPRLQRHLTTGLLLAGFRAWDSSRGEPLGRRRDEIVDYLQTQTAYRSNSEVLAIFRSVGLDANVNMRDSRMYRAVRWLPATVGPGALAMLTNTTIDVVG